MGEDDLREQGLVGECYDSMFSIQQRLRKINDIPIPLRQGLTFAQLGVGISTFIASIIVFGLVIHPITNLLGIHLNFVMILVILFGPPIAAGQRVVKPMRYNKSITSTMTSWWRSITDDPVHARGLPVPTRPEDTVDGPTLVYWRPWFPADDIAPAEETDRVAEHLLAGYVTDAPEWAVRKAHEHAEEQHRRRHTARSTTVTTSTTRSQGAKVLLDDTK